VGAAQSLAKRTRKGVGERTSYTYSESLRQSLAKGSGVRVTSGDEKEVSHAAKCKRGAQKKRRKPQSRGKQQVEAPGWGGGGKRFVISNVKCWSGGSLGVGGRGSRKLVSPKQEVQRPWAGGRLCCSMGSTITKGGQRSAERTATKKSIKRQRT